MPWEDTEQNAENEEEVYDMASCEGDFSCFRYIFVSQTNASHAQRHRKLAIVNDQNADRDDDRSQEYIHCLFTIEVEAASQAWIASYVQVIETVEDHEVYDENHKEYAQVGDGTLVHTLAAENNPLEAAPGLRYLLWPEPCKFPQPIH